MATRTQRRLSRRHLSPEQFDEAWEREAKLEEQRRRESRKRAVKRSRARRIERAERSGKVRFAVLAVALTLTVIAVVVLMFETLAWLVGG